MVLERNVLPTRHSASLSTGNLATFWSADAVLTVWQRPKRGMLQRGFDLHLLAVSVIALGFCSKRGPSLLELLGSERLPFLTDKREKKWPESTPVRVTPPTAYNTLLN